MAMHKKEKVVETYNSSVEPPTPNCRICGETMLPLEGNGYYYCGNHDFAWHFQAAFILNEMQRCHSPRLLRMMQLDIDEIVSQRQVIDP